MAESLTCHTAPYDCGHVAKQMALITYFRGCGDMVIIWPSLLVAREIDVPIDNETRAVLRLVWPSILLQSAPGRVATAAETLTA